jgi:hypothetical protein
MSNISKKPEVATSPDRFTFQLESARQEAAEKGTKVPEYYENFWKTAKEQDEANLVDPEWQKYNMEYDLRSTKWICDKAKASDSYAQNLYAAMCNMQFIKMDIIPILKDQRWSTTWRSSGGIVADMREAGDYIDWYCSGIGNNDAGWGLDGKRANGYVSEGEVTDEIQEDLKKIGWSPVDWDNDE